MGKRISWQTRKELLEAIRLRYRESWKVNKTRILDEFVALTGYHRKYGIRLLSQPCDSAAKTVQDGPIRSRRVYDEAVKEALIVMWEASDRICGKRLKAIIPELTTMKPRLLLVCVLITMASGCSRKNDRVVGTEDPNALLSTIADTRVRYERLVRAVEKLGPVKETSQFWSAIANSQEYAKSHRRLAVFQLFGRHIEPGMPLSELSTILDKPTWLKDTDVSVVDRLYGYLPLNKLSPGTVFHIRVFPDLPKLRWSISLRISGQVGLEDFLKVLNSQDAQQQVKDATILELGLCTPGFSDGIWRDR
jgi:hypothetical protein